MEQDGGFRNFLIGSSEMDELSQSLNYLGHPLMDWLVLFDPENWPESKNFGVMLQLGNIWKRILKLNVT